MLSFCAWARAWGVRTGKSTQRKASKRSGRRTGQDSTSSGLGRGLRNLRSREKSMWRAPGWGRRESKHTQGSERIIRGAAAREGRQDAPTPYSDALRRPQRAAKGLTSAPAAVAGTHAQRHLTQKVSVKPRAAGVSAWRRCRLRRCQRAGDTPSQTPGCAVRAADQRRTDDHAEQESRPGRAAAGHERDGQVTEHRLEVHGRLAPARGGCRGGGGAVSAHFSASPGLSGA